MMGVLTTENNKKRWSVLSDKVREALIRGIGTLGQLQKRCASVQ